ncbi:HNH endonuclease [Heyndrickxia sporothermodurans]|uniref:HNH endonuclease signature motif containing protein n=1 Tax=Heyndrickxia sporothermodurans TaxID=46224 RepID=UPI002E1A8C06|nr:HNH endonuclease [Heyndrickxia sporothermodurans]
MSSVAKFSGTVKFAHLGDIGISSVKTGIKNSVNNGMTQVRNLVETAGKASTTRLKSAASMIKDVPNKLIDDTIEVGRFIDSTVTHTKNIFSTRKPLDLAMEGFGNTGSVRIPVENTHAAENYFAAKLGRGNGVSGGSKGTGKGKGVSETNLRNIDDFINGNKKFDEVIEDYAKVYKEHVDLNKPWSWDDTIPGGDSLSSAQKRKIKEMAIEKGHIPEIKVTKADGMRYGFADFASAGVVEETVQLPEEFWRLSDKEQFKWLDEQIGGARKGMTWHHTEVPGKMELVPFGIHNITPHNGGRTKGMWADAPR